MQKLYLIGMPGSGKSKIGRTLSSRVELPFFDLDDYIVKNEGRDINAIFSDNGEDYFRVLENKYLRALTEEHESFVMATGGGAPCFFDNINYMNSHGTVIFLNPPLWQIGKRMMGKKGNQKRPLLKDVDDKQLFSELEEKLKVRLPFYRKARFEIDVGLDFFEMRIQRIVERLESLEKQT